MELSRPITVSKSKIDEIIDEDQRLTKLIYYYILSATVWLIFGSFIGLFLGLKFIYPDWGNVAWLSFGRLRPIHTNVVFWGWTSLSMIGLALYVVPRTSQNRLYNLLLSRQALYVINLSVLLGVVSLFFGANNGGQEYREFTWPVMLLFSLGLASNLLNLYKTVASRKTKEIYLSNWYILAAFIWTIVVVVIAYLPFYQYSLGETIIQGYYMHMGVGMWFTPMVLGLTYYFLPKLLNKPIYSYSLGVLAFWTQMVFYSLIGAHHFVFAPIPWWLQTVAIVFSFGMFVTLFAGTANFLLTMKGSFGTIAKSYSLPFILVGVIFYFLASGQGSLEALRSLNKIWHFTNYTIAHSHLTMYGFVVFLIWGGIYALMPRLTGNEPSHILVGIHFWFALIGLLIYGFALMIGGTLQGLSWLDKLPFINSVELMAPYWLWRAVGGTLMFIAHLVFAFNIIKMQPTRNKEYVLDTAEETI
ncbi:MAG: cbb3-type cytochrome c oxidase subunit I [Ignavibacteriae bacterium]|nr:cbb3-type cytochrome c oxidase subunit I [Ignavibacteriota bacterium]